MQFSQPIFSRRIAFATMAMTILAMLSIWNPMTAANSQEAEAKRVYRVFENAWPGDVLELKRVINLQSEKFAEELEVEVKNISSQPIYFVGIFASLPDCKPFVAAHEAVGFNLFYGRPLKGGMAQAGDIPIMPGETAILRADQWTRSGQYFAAFPQCEQKMKESGVRVNLVFQQLRFGDGTGYQHRTKIGVRP